MTNFDNVFLAFLISLIVCGGWLYLGFRAYYKAKFCPKPDAFTAPKHPGNSVPESERRQPEKILEHWKAVPNFPAYKVSSFGRVMSYRQTEDGRILKTRRKDGKNRVMLVDENGDGHSVSLGRLLVETFYPGLLRDDEVVIHADGDRQNFEVSNLTTMLRRDAGVFYRSLKKNS